MSDRLGLKRIHVKNYRSLADVSLDLEPINVLFGPNGAGKSTLLDVLWFVHDCAAGSVPEALSARDQGIGLLYDHAQPNSLLEIEVATDHVEYLLQFQFSSGRAEPTPGELLRSLTGGEPLLRRELGSATAEVYNRTLDQVEKSIKLRGRESLALKRYLNAEPESDEVDDLDRIFHSIRFYHSRSFDSHNLKQIGSKMSPGASLRMRADNLWSVLRNIEGRRQLDDRYTSIMGFMSEAFPDFKGLVIEATGPGSLYASFLEKDRREPILASGISDGHLQLLTILTALFSEGRDRYSLLLFDEPDLSLHPWAIAVLAKAMNHAAKDWNKQILLTTHSPVLMSQFELNESLTVETREGRTYLTRLSEMEEIRGDLEHYAPGSLYMSETIAPQSATADIAECRAEP